MNANKKRISEAVIGCAYEVSNALGCGFLESVYEDALAVEMRRAGLRFERQAPLTVYYRGHEVGRYFADFVVEDRLVVELKALATLKTEHEAQVMNYLRACEKTVGLLLNFGTPRLGVRRIVWKHPDQSRI